MRKLEKITIQNFKSIRNQTLELGQLNVFIGGNGVGKSNLVQAFRFLREIVQRNLATYSLERGADSLLYFGSRTSRSMSFHLEFGEDNTSNAYKVILSPTDEGNLIIKEEIVYFHDRTSYPKPYNEIINMGGRESTVSTTDSKIARHVRSDLESYRLYHFHDTSDIAPMKSASAIDDNSFLRTDASNLAAFLFFCMKDIRKIFATSKTL